MAGDEIIFRNGAVFDGRMFLPEGTCVRVSGGTITAVGSAPSARPSFGMLNPATPPVSSNRRLSVTIRSGVSVPRRRPPRLRRGVGVAGMSKILSQLLT